MNDGIVNNQIDIEVLPEIEILEFQSHPVRYKSYQYLLSAIIWAIPSIALICLWIFTPAKWVIIPTAVITLLIFISLITIPISFRRRAYVLRDLDLTYKKGWLFYSTVTIPFNRIQHTEVSQGPIEKRYDICSLKIFTAGGSASDLSIPGLEEEEAQQMRVYISKKASLNA